MYDSIIIGAGPAGLSAAIYLKNANKKILVIEKNAPGGKLLKTNKINNYLGYNGLDASNLAYEMYVQSQNLDINIVIEKVIDIKKENNIFTIITDKGSYTSKSVLIACGRIEKQIGLPNENDLIGKGISYCVKCDASLYKDKDVALLGNIDDALYLSNIAKNVIFISNDNVEKDNIKVINSKIKFVTKKEEVINSIILENGEEYNISCLFVENGYTPNIDFIDNLKIERNNNYITVDKNMKTSIDCLYAAGDIIDKKVYQVITAASEGAIAALSIIRDVKE